MHTCKGGGFENFEGGGSDECLEGGAIDGWCEEDGSEEVGVWTGGRTESEDGFGADVLDRFDMEFDCFFKPDFVDCDCDCDDEDDR